MNYDDWLVYTEHEYRGWNEKPYKCNECEKPIDHEGYCSWRCVDASNL